ncbi:hypothetical protein BDY17DRAFT_351727 [Neohortaea acidophila]|uniref:Methyltransferase-domain-containing protein n=1 Tax=Neohortaea acidophila TaxID=245834 RepID=A0A6A6PYP5_9PEZI|nr:uncharacterized protein BDY17DRAFT_351727 [Neohortaea acidophila]KAF2484864.1 hypothetical protein BDY17DRAFT_351727 [Neohortaea acidophila]
MAHTFATVLGDEVADADEGAETFDLFSHFHSSQDLGMVDGKATEVEVTVAGRDFTIKQSPGLLRSNREAGTTGAAVWRTSVRFAEWLAWSANPLFLGGVLDSSSSVLELGTGISALAPIMIGERVKKVIATDQQYTLKLLQENISSNVRKSRQPSGPGSGKNIDVCALDWETDDIPSFVRMHVGEDGFDAVVACDCVFNYALIQPLVDTCIETCRARKSVATQHQPTACIIAQQLRQPEVFEQWLNAFIKAFRVWRVPDELIRGCGQEPAGFVIHIGILQPHIDAEKST